MDDGLDFQSLTWLAGACATFTAIWTAFKAVNEARRFFTRPSEDIRARLAAVEGRLEAHDEMLARDKRRIDEADESLHLLLGGMLQLLDHDLDGNNVEALHEQKRKIQDFLIKR